MRYLGTMQKVEKITITRNFVIGVRVCVCGGVWRGRGWELETMRDDESMKCLSFRKRKIIKGALGNKYPSIEEVTPKQYTF